VHLNDLGGVLDRDTRIEAETLEVIAKQRFIADQDHLNAEMFGGLESPLDIRKRTVVPPHGVNGDFHRSYDPETVRLGVARP
jgi:hypothetical protein